MKRKLMILFVMVVLSVGIAAAYMLREQEVTNTFTPAVYSCEVLETVADNTKTEIKVENTGNVAGYIRVKLVSCWVDEQDNVMGIPSEEPVFEPDTENGWRKDGDTYYYANQVEPGEQTPNLLKSSITLTGKTYQGTTVYQVIDVIAEISAKDLSK